MIEESKPVIAMAQNRTGGVKTGLMKSL